MGIRVKRTGKTAIRLAKTGDITSRQLRRLHRDAAYEIAEVARQMAPFKTGRLEGDIAVHEAFVNRFKRFTITTQNVPYAVMRHESVYNLGPGSRLKNENGRYEVGRKYMTRAAAVVIEEGRYIERARKAVQDAIRKSLL